MGNGRDVETLRILYIFPDLIHMKEVISKPRKLEELWSVGRFSNEDSVITFEIAPGYNKKSETSSVVGDSTKRSGEKGEIFHKKIIYNKAINDIKDMNVGLTDNVPLLF